MRMSEKIFLIGMLLAVLVLAGLGANAPRHLYRTCPELPGTATPAPTDLIPPTKVPLDP